MILKKKTFILCEEQDFGFELLKTAPLAKLLLQLLVKKN